MTKKLLLGTTALVALGALMVATPAFALEVSVGGYGRFGAVFGNNDRARAQTNIRNFYFRDEFEVHIKGKGKDDATGTEYGVHIELEMDNTVTGVSPNVQIDESWLWFKGSWGELRLGNEDGASNLMRVTAAEIAAGTGGIDGWTDEIASVGFHIMDNSDSTKIVYFTPDISGFQAGFSYTPDSGHYGGVAPVHNNGDYEHWIEAAATYKADMGGAKFRVGAQFARANGETNAVPDFAGYSVGAIVEVSGFKVAGSWTRNSYDFDVSSVSALRDNTRWTLGVGASLGPANVSLTGVKQDSDQGPDPRNIVLSGDVTLFPGVALQGDVSFFDLDTGVKDNGVTGVVRVHVAM